MLQRIFFFLFLVTCIFGKEYLLFSVDSSWHLVHPSQLTKQVTVAFVNSHHESINLATEKASLSLEDYCSLVKKLHKKNGFELTDLNKIDFPSLSFRLFHMKKKEKTKMFSLLQAICKYNDTFYVFSGGCPQEHFLSFQNQYRSFLKNMHIEHDLFKEIKDLKRKELLQKKIGSFSLPLSKKDRKKLKNTIAKEYQDMGIVWQYYLFKDLQIPL